MYENSRRETSVGFGYDVEVCSFMANLRNRRLCYSGCFFGGVGWRGGFSPGRVDVDMNEMAVGQLYKNGCELY